MSELDDLIGHANMKVRNEPKVWKLPSTLRFIHQSNSRKYDGNYNQDLFNNTQNNYEINAIPLEDYRNHVDNIYSIGNNKEFIDMWAKKQTIKIDQNRSKNDARREFNKKRKEDKMIRLNNFIESKKVYFRFLQS